MASSKQRTRPGADLHLGEAPSGFEPEPAELVAERLDVPRDRRERAALLVLGIGRGATPEELTTGIAADIVDAFADELERNEALAHVDLLLEVLSPRAEVSR